MRPLADESGKMVEIRATEEKGSDVNLATYLLCDGFMNLYDTAVLLTGDSDFIESIKMVKNQLGKAVKVFSPSTHVSVELKNAASSYGVIRKSAIRKCQFDTFLRDSKGNFHKPKQW
jgi:uncharacterized LabA/DUF88 family protein